MEYLVLSLLGLSGIVIHILMKFRDEVSKEPKNGKTTKERLVAIWNKFDLLGNVLYGVFALLLVLIMVAIRDHIEAVLPITKLSIIFIGYAADSAFKNLKPEKL